MAKTDTDIKYSIEKVIKAFSVGTLTENSLNFFQVLGYNTDRQQPLLDKTFACFKEYYLDSESRFNEEKALTKEWQQIDLLFQLTKEEVTGQNSLFDTAQVDRTIMEAYLFFCIELNDREYTRTALSQITREINKVFKMPVMVLFKLGEKLSLAVINRRLHKKDAEKDVLEKVTLIKDINIPKPHRAHIEILFDLTIEELRQVHKFTNFVELHEAWKKTLDTKELNKRFYKDLSNWYFYAKEQVYFPDDIIKDREERNSTSLIRLITRVVFVWFIKEKELVPETLFIKNDIKVILKNFLQKGSSNYYKAILQNLFFGTLNQKISDRRFAVDGDFLENKNEYGVKTLFRYQNLFTINQQEVLKLYHDVPFLNGGLFECLDKINDDGKILYEDGFSRNAKKTAFVPDYLFFSDDQTIDLNEIYGTKNKSYKVRGLIDILNSYKFTISENTPIEEEVALDPELLGEVFENLLASYNPETQSTARKQTGSFYTPREIVNYMVDESLKAYLKEHLIKQELINEDDANINLAFLFEYNEKEHLFNEKQTDLLIELIDNCKILDPACGSGAFPMGVLHKLVHILHKLDTQNKKWEERQLIKARKIDDPFIREKSVYGIEEAFASNELDYGRKLYLIENCIYGVDIQTIAVQIAKLRFFISLIVDQKKQSNKENFGIRSLPNLETRFVAANTLIGLDVQHQYTFRNPAIDKLLIELNELRHLYFSAGNRKAKLGYQKKDQDLRKTISDILVHDGWLKSLADKIAKFDPYDQNVSSLFFEPEWMFSVKDGFDIVIGNPPYIQLQKDGGKLANLYKPFNYKTFERTGDIYSLFYENGLHSLKPGGHLCFITSNKWMRAGYGKSLRKFFNTKSPKLLIDLGPGVFENATVDTNILLIAQEPNKNKLYGIALTKEAKGNDLASYFESHKQALPNMGEAAWFIGNNAELNLKEKIERIGKPLKDWDISIYRGVLTGLNEAFIIDTETRNKLIAADPKSAKIIKPILRGRDIRRYSYEWAGLWLIFIPWHFPLHEDSSIVGSSKKAETEFQKQFPSIYNHLYIFKDNLSKRNASETGIRYEWYALQRCAATYYAEFEKEKLVWQEMTKEPSFAYDSDGVYCNDTCRILTGKDIKYFLSIFNSSFFCKIFSKYYSGGSLGSEGIRFKHTFMEKYPIPPITKDNKFLVNELINLSNYLIELKHQSIIQNTSQKEKEIDQLVYQLYDLTPEEIAIIEQQP